MCLLELMLRSASVHAKLPAYDVHDPSVLLNPCWLLVRAGPQVQISVQPVCLLHRPLCFLRLSALGAALPSSTQGGRLLDSINRLQDPAGRMLCKARLVEGGSAPPDVNVQVCLMTETCMSHSHDALFVQGVCLNGTYCTARVVKGLSAALGPSPEYAEF